MRNWRFKVRRRERSNTDICTISCASIDSIDNRVATVLEDPGNCWNWWEKIPGLGKFLNLGRGP